MEDVFRFMVIRPAEVPASNVTIPLETTSDYQEGLQGCRLSNAAWPCMLENSKAYINSEAFVKDASKLNFRKQLKQFKKRLEELLGGVIEKPVTDRLEKLVKEVFEQDSTTVINKPEFQTIKQQVLDSIVAIYISPSDHYTSLEFLTETARLINLIELISKREKELETIDGLKKVLTATLLLPPNIFPVRSDQIYPIGIGDLLLVKQQIVGYETGEISHIENILAKETKKRIFKHTLTTEKTELLETETTKETTNELQSTEKFELKAEVQNVLLEEHDVKTGLAVTAKFGASVELKTNLDYAYKQSKTETQKLANTFAKDVTTRAITKVIERVKQQQTSRVTEVFDDTNEHGFDNTSNSEHVVGIYQWINKIYEMQVFNYGKRLLFDITIPEPAAFLRDAVRAKQEARKKVEAPDPFSLVHNLLSENPAEEHFFGKYVEKYGASGVEPPPKRFETVSKSFSGATTSEDLGKDNLTASDLLNIPIGYELRQITVKATFNRKPAADPTNKKTAPIMIIYVGSKAFTNPEVNGEWTQSIDQTVLLISGNDLEMINASSVAISMGGTKVLDYSFNIVLNCERRKETFEKWQLNTHSAILKAYQQKLGDYEEAVSTEKFEQDRDLLGPLGGNPEFNRQIERRELKRSFLAILTGRDLVDKGFNDIKENTPPPKFPRVNIDDRKRLKDDDTYIRFFEQAFEWEHIMYFFYPYFWGRSSTWYEKLIGDNPDPLFANFLNAGSARLVVPVRPSFNEDIQYFLMTGEIWKGGNVPDVSDKRYLPITEEIKETTGAPGIEKPVGDSWQNRVPTSLVMVRSKATLPKWKRKDPNGWKWEPEI